MSRLPAAPAVLALAVLVLLAGCGQSTASPEARTTTAATSGPPRGEDARSKQQRTLAILEQLYDQLGADDVPPLAEQKAPGAEAVCTLKELDPDVAWTEIVFVPVDSPSTEADRVRAWLAAENYRLTWSRQGGAVTSHALDGYKVTVAEWPDGRVELSVESPCLEDST